MEKILIVDDEQDIRNVIKEYATYSGYEVYEAEDGIYAVEMCKKSKYDLIIMDVMMPKLDGFATVRQIRKFDENVPFLMLSARGKEYDKLLGFELGIDDYVTKPFSPKELMARVKVIISRNNKDENSCKIEKEKLCFDSLVIDRLGRNVFIDDKKIDLTPKEYELLLYLVVNKNIALSREQILSNVWGYDFFGEDRTVDTHVKMLRNSIGKYRDKIVTVRGMGYKFED